MDRACSAIGEDCIQGFGGKERRKKTTGITLICVEAGYRTDLTEIEWSAMDWTGPAQFRNP
jgi:hypothetical protein